MTLFNIALEKIVRDSKLEAKLFQTNGSQLILAHADDIDVVETRVINREETFVKLQHEASKMGPMINEDKTKYMHISRAGRGRVGQNVTMNEYNFENFTQFKYLGSIITADSDISEEIKYK